MQCNCIYNWTATFVNIGWKMWRGSGFHRVIVWLYNGAAELIRWSRLLVVYTYVHDLENLWWHAQNHFSMCIKMASHPLLAILDTILGRKYISKARWGNSNAAGIVWQPLLGGTFYFALKNENRITRTSEISMKFLLSFCLWNSWRIHNIIEGYCRV